MKREQAYAINQFESTAPIERPLILKLAGLYYDAPDHNLVNRITDEFVMLYCFDGAGWAQLNGVTTRVNKGDVIFLPPNSTHGYGNEQGSCWSIIWFHFTGGYGEYFFNQLGASKSNGVISVLANYSPYEELQAVIDTIAKIKSYTDVINAEAALVTVLCKMTAGAKFTLKRGSIQKTYVDTATEILEESENCFVSLDELSNKVGISKYYLIRLFKEYLGTTPKEYADNIKLKKACRLLKETELSILQISTELGFCNQYHFSKSFKQYFGYSPTKFRRLI